MDNLKKRITKLKAKAYDCVLNIEHFTEERKKINIQIMNLQTQLENTKKKEEKKEDGGNLPD